MIRDCKRVVSSNALDDTGVRGGLRKVFWLLNSVLGIQIFSTINNLQVTTSLYIAKEYTT